MKALEIVGWLFP